MSERVGEGPSATHWRVKSETTSKTFHMAWMLIGPLVCRKRSTCFSLIGQILSVVMTRCHSVRPAYYIYPSYAGTANKHGCHVNEEMSRRVISIYRPICSARRTPERISVRRTPKLRKRHRSELCINLLITHLSIMRFFPPHLFKDVLIRHSSNVSGLTFMKTWN